MMTWILIGAISLLLLITVAVRLKRAIGQSDRFPYNMKSVLFSPAERSFLGVLDQAVGNHYRIFGKVRIADVVETKRGLRGSHRQSAFNRIQSKHFDFLLCDKDDLSIVCAVELDDKTHRKNSRQQRDAFVAELCQAIALPLLRVSAKRTYPVPELRAMILDATQQRLEPSLLPNPPAISTDGA